MTETHVIYDTKGNNVRDVVKYFGGRHADEAEAMEEYWASVGGHCGEEYLRRKQLGEEKKERGRKKRERLAIIEIDYEVWKLQADMRCCWGGCIQAMRKCRGGTTCLTDNRAEDKKRVEGRYPLLQEHGSADVVIHHRGHPVSLTGYQRVVYGDHGPYIEFTPSQLSAANLTKNEQKLNPMRYYDEHTIVGTDLLFYEQLRTVDSKRYPPKGGRYSVRNVQWGEGYAGYKVGMWYVAADADFEIIPRQSGDGAVMSNIHETHRRLLEEAKQLSAYDVTEGEDLSGRGQRMVVEISRQLEELSKHDIEKANQTYLQQLLKVEAMADNHGI